MGRVLIVEDDAATRAALANLLGAAGHVICEAGDGGAAVAQLRAGLRPCVVLLDMMMPGVDGWQFLQQRHADPALAVAPVLVLTADAGVSPTTARGLGADDVLHKPVDSDDLLHAVRRYCGAGC